jgi:hypothetical protein
MGGMRLADQPRGGGPMRHGSTNQGQPDAEGCREQIKGRHVPLDGAVLDATAYGWHRAPTGTAG